MPFEPSFDTPKVPGIWLKFSKALANTPSPVPHRMVVVGVGLSAGSVDELVPKQVYAKSEAEGFWGQGSMIAEMCGAALAQGKLELWGVSVDEEAGGTAATGSIA